MLKVKPGSEHNSEGDATDTDETWLKGAAIGLLRNLISQRLTLQTNNN